MVYAADVPIVDVAFIQAAINGTREVTLAVIATSVSLVVIFLPVAFMAAKQTEARNLRLYGYGVKGFTLAYDEL